MRGSRYMFLLLSREKKESTGKAGKDREEVAHMKKKNAVGIGAAWFLLGVCACSVCASEQAEDLENPAMVVQDSQVAQSNEMAEKEEVVQDWMVPVYADELKNGSYEIQAASSSSMFYVEECVLTVKDGTMTAVMTMGGQGYLKVYMGTGEEAVVASEEEYIPFVEREDGRHTYEVPVEALDCGIACTAFSKNRQKWYDRTLVFEASSLPLEAFQEPRWTTPESLELEDGSYTIEVALEGFGKAQVESPAALYISEGEAEAEIVFGSSNYDYVLVNDVKYELWDTEGNSAFRIPVTGFDYNIPIVADSIALGTPREIAYILKFDSATITKTE